MKQCPACKTTYTDVTLRFCLADGSLLADMTDEQSTIIRNQGVSYADTTVELGSGGPRRVEIPVETSSSRPQPTFQPAATARVGSSGNIFKMLVVVIGLGIFAVIAVAAGVFIYFKVITPEPVTNTSKNDIKTTVSPTPATNEMDELRDQIANLEKLLNDQKKTDQGVNIPLKMPEQSKTRVPARVNSPGDGFLALRTLPSSEIGERIMKIPHGAQVSIGGCGPVVRPVSRPGRWCQATFNGNSGWVFDAYLVY